MRLVGLAVAAVGLGALPPGASAAIVSPPPPPHLQTVFPDRDFVSLGGYGGGEALTVRVVRNGVTIGTASGTADSQGIFEVNHPGGACWDTVTPNILPQDQVVVSRTGAPANQGEATTTAAVQAAPAVSVGAAVVVRGTARTAAGKPMDLSLVEQRIVNPDFRTDAVGLPRRDIRAVADGSGEGTLSYDPVGPANRDGTKWTARYTGLTAAQHDAAINGQTRVLAWMATDAVGDRLGMTIHEVGEIGGPGFGGCPPLGDYAVTQSDHPAVTKAMLDGGAPLVLAGVAQGASSAAVTLSDEDPATADVTVRASTPTPATGGQTWSAAFSAAQLAGLGDGTLTATGSYTVGGSAIGGVAKTLEKDVVAPGAPGATPGTGTYAQAQMVSLGRPDPRSVVRFTADGSDPADGSPVAPAQLGVTSSQTIKAIAVDQVGNVSPVAAFAYTIGGPGTGAAGAGVKGVAGAGSARRLALRAGSMQTRISRSRLRADGLRLTMRLAPGTKVVRVAAYRARNGKRTGRPLAVLFRKAPASAIYRLRLRDRALLRKLRAGRYVIEVTPGISRAELGVPSSFPLLVTR